MNRLRIAIRGAPVAPFLSLMLLWVGVATSVADGSHSDCGAPFVSGPDGANSVPSHDHRLCILVQSSPGWASPGTAPLAEPLLLPDVRPATSTAGVPFWTPADPSARAPPLQA